MKKLMMSLVVASVFFGASLEAEAVSVSVDFDLGAPGIQPAATIVNGDSITANVVVSELTDTLQGFEFDLDFVSTIVNANSVASGGFLTGQFGEFSTATVNTIPPDVEFDLTALSTPSNDDMLP